MDIVKSVKNNIIPLIGAYVIGNYSVQFWYDTFVSQGIWVNPLVNRLFLEPLGIMQNWGNFMIAPELLLAPIGTAVLAFFIIREIMKLIQKK
jgi:hypothetical protein